MRPEQITQLMSVSAPAVDPHGNWAVVSVTSPDLDADADVGQLWLVQLGRTPSPRRLTRGTLDTDPRVSPDGRLVGFLRRDWERPRQVHVVPAAGGESVQVTEAKLGVDAFEFSPDAQRVAFVARVAEEGRYGTVDGVAASAEDARRIDTLQFQENGLGWVLDRRAQMFVVDVPDPYGPPPVTPVGRAARGRSPDDIKAGLVPVATQLTFGDADHREPAWTPDGGSVVVTSARQEGRDTELVTHLYRVTAGAEPTLIPTGVSASGACFSGDGGTLFFVGEELGQSGRDFVRCPGLYAMPADGGNARRLTDPDTDVQGPLQPVGEDGVAVIVAARGRSEARVVRLDGSTRPLGGSSSALAAAAAGAAGLVATIADVDTPGELALLGEDGERRLTDFAAPLRAASRLSVARELIAGSADGYPVHGWSWLPQGPGPHPVLLAIHGGPQAHYGAAFFDEFQVYTEAGYAVVACNPRGSGGYGEAHARAIKNDFGRLDAADVLAFLDHALASEPALDASRLGIMGGSYGGYLTAWIIAHSDRFAGAIVERGYLDPASFLGSSDIGWFFVEQYNGTELDRVNAQSPTLLTDRVRTPTLVIHSEDDLRCPLSQALRYYTQLKLSGVQAELLVFPGENHELSRSGSPHHRKQRFEAILEWWGRMLPIPPSTGSPHT